MGAQEINCIIIKNISDPPWTLYRPQNLSMTLSPDSILHASLPATPFLLTPPPPPHPHPLSSIDRFIKTNANVDSVVGGGGGLGCWNGRSWYARIFEGQVMAFWLVSWLIEHRLDLVGSFCLPGSFNFIAPPLNLIFTQSSTVECVQSSESDFVLVAGGTHLVSPWYDPSRLTGRKTSSMYILYMISTYRWLLVNIRSRLKIVIKTQNMFISNFEFVSNGSQQGRSNEGGREEGRGWCWNNRVIQCNAPANKALQYSMDFLKTAMNANWVAPT